MRKRTKLIIVVSGLCLVSFVVGWILPLIGLVWLHARYENYSYMQRPVECAPEDLIPDLEKMFDINFPKVIKEIKTAKTLGSWDSNTIDFIVKFCAEPDIVDTFIKSFPQGVVLEDYDPEWDMRSVGITSAPAWFTMPIQKGRMGDIPGYGDKEIYIDTTNEKEFVVYFYGFL